MKLPKASAVIAAAVLAPAVLFPSSAVAADGPRPTGLSSPDTSDQESQDRAEVQRILADKESGPGVREAAEKALAGDAAAVRHFLDVELADQRIIDNRVRVSRLINNAGPVLKEAAKQVLRHGTPAEVEKFLKEGQFKARAEDDDRAKVQGILADKESGPGVREAAEKALAGDAAAVRHFLDVELAEQRIVDNQVRVSQLINNAGPVLKEAAKQVLRHGTPAEVEKFLKEGQFKARAEDDDRAKVQGILADKESGPGVREAAEKALAGDAAAVRHFLDVELAEQRIIDNRFRVYQLINNAGPVLKEAAKNVLRHGTPAEVEKFLKEGQFTARAEDEKAGGNRTPDPTEQPQQPGQDVKPVAVTTTDTAGTPATTAPATTAPATPVAGPGQLAATGSEGLGWEVGGAAAVLAAGAALVAVSRRRSTEG
ncbi:ALF repeat-containing protein [Kitasatospora sp. NPDC089797]|uniref:ALF repeat-containing protein n=1 Tax=Kitasatospora sp. NPDC089797 TaxID=3155298 RepID=UPI00341B790B